MADPCPICTLTPQIWAIPQCNHPICSLCALRLRALYKKKNCVVCKAENNLVLFTPTIQTYIPTPQLPLDTKLGIHFQSEKIQEETLKTLRFNCPHKECDYTSMSGWKDLKAHVRKEHHLLFCDICIKNKKVFANEHTLYTQASLASHIKSGTPDDTSFNGHPSCGFCSNAFYSADELYAHCKENHETCFVCVRQRIQHQYYRNWAELEEHFRSDHYCCLEQECLDAKFVVFASDLEYKAHMLEKHPQAKVGQRSAARQQRTIETDFNYGDRSTSPQRNRKGGNNGDGRKGGRGGFGSQSTISSRPGRSIRPPASFGALTIADDRPVAPQPARAGPSNPSSATQSATHSAAQSPPKSHPTILFPSSPAVPFLLSCIRNAVSGDISAQLRLAATQFDDGLMPLQEFFDLWMVHAPSLWGDVADAMADEAKASKMREIWRDHQVEQKRQAEANAYTQLSWAEQNQANDAPRVPKTLVISSAKTLPGRYFRSGVSLRGAGSSGGFADILASEKRRTEAATSSVGIGGGGGAGKVAATSSVGGPSVDGGLWPNQKAPTQSWGPSAQASAQRAQDFPVLGWGAKPKPSVVESAPPPLAVDDDEDVVLGGGKGGKRKKNKGKKVLLTWGS